ncbi:immunoglobulin superfamily member 5 [Sciurus carolinensis]|uniref:immunoglobulin superfamily member 5 n=1 Tax=Sciurus carolinensis TaxID=30640 RepID=UPI001FB40027|nr:immunoglobulin superfamily member 5 [Sciurus carolinensis]
MQRWRAGRWEDVLAVLVVLASLSAPGSSYQIVVGPNNATVLEGAEARFNCTVSPGWKLIMWALKGTVVLSVTPREPIITNDRFTSESYEDLDGNFVSEMIIHNTQPSDSGWVRCSLQNSDLEAFAFLAVQVMGTLSIPNDSIVVTEDQPCTVTCRALGWSPLPDISWEVAVPVSQSSYYSFLEPGEPRSTVSVLTLTAQGNGTLTCVANLRSVQAHKAAAVNLTVVQSPSDNAGEAGSSLPTWAIALLAVLLTSVFILIFVLIIIFCCCCPSWRKKKESTYQIKIRNSEKENTEKGTSETKSKNESENYGFSSDEQKTTQMAPLPPKSREVSARGQPASSPAPQETKKHHPGPASHPQVSFNIASPQKVRSATLV